MIHKLFKTVSIFFATYVLSLLVNSSYGDSSYYKRDNSLTRPYQGSGMVIPGWEIFGSTIVTPSFVRLTPDQQSRAGGLYNNNPLQVRNWEVHLHFKISGRGKELYGDGMAFWYVKDPLEQGNVFGAKDPFVGLGIFFDTYANQNGAHSHGHPYISAMINNGSSQYDHDRDGTHTELAGCEGKFRNVERDTVALIRYENDILSVHTDFDGQGWKECFNVQGVILPTHYHIGVSAATGDLTDNHDVVSVKTFELTPPPNVNDVDRRHVLPSAAHFAAPRARVDDQPQGMSNLKFFLIIVCAIVVLVILAALGFTFFQKHQETSRKRFY